LWGFEGVDEGGECGGLVATAGVVEKIAGEHGAPVFEDLDQSAICDHLRERFLHRCSDSYAVQHRLNYEVWVVECCWSLRIDGESLAAFFELPAVDAGAEAEADACVIFEIAGGAGKLVGFEVLGRADDCEAHVFADADCNHVALDEFTDLDACVVLLGHEVDGVVGGGDLQNYFGIGACELCELRQEHHVGCRARNDEPDAACWTFFLLSYFGKREFDALESRIEISKKCSAGSRGRYAPRCSC